jgi:hypothetical protein
MAALDYAWGMQSGSVNDPPLAELLGSLIAQGASGRLDVIQDKRKRAFWFEGGQLSYSKSNLRSETVERIAERMPGLDADKLGHAQLVLRIGNAMALKDGSWTFTPNMVPPKRAPQALLPILARMVMEKLPENTISQRLAGLGGRFPRRSMDSSDPMVLGLDAMANELLLSMDGARPLEDVLEFSPLEIAAANRVVYLGLITGIVEFGEDEATMARIKTTIDHDSLSTQVHREASVPSSPSSLADLFDAPIQTSPAGKAALGGPSEPSRAPEPEPVPEVSTQPASPKEDPELMNLRAELQRVELAENHFEILEVHWDVGEPALRKAYFALAQRLHPDRWTGSAPQVSELAADIFAKVNEAWEDLGDDEKRKVYTDRVIHGIKSEDELAMEKVRAILAAEDEFKAGQMMFRRGNLVKAHELFLAAHLAVPEEAEFQAYYGYTLFKLNYGKDSDQAQLGVDLIKKAIDNHVKLDGGWVLMGLVYRSAGNHKRSIGSFRKALEMNASNVDAERELRRSMQEMQRDKAKAAKEEEKKAGFFGRFFKK